jgi:hypothetical protein
MNWQEVAVGLVVAAALVFLVGRFVRPRRRRQGAQTFVPLSSLRTKQKKDESCH